MKTIEELASACESIEALNPYYRVQLATVVREGMPLLAAVTLDVLVECLDDRADAESVLWELRSAHAQDGGRSAAHLISTGCTPEQVAEIL